MDGGVAFGVVPKTIWNKMYTADDQNMINICSRSLLIETGQHRLLIDTGMGQKRGDKYYGYKHLSNEHTLLQSLKKAGFAPADITDVLFTHLHDDHVGGATYFDENKALQLTFPNARYHISKSHWEWANNPNPREKAAYFPDNFIPLQESGRLNLITEEQTEFMPGISLRILDGHTTGQLIPIITNEEQTLAYVTDFIPSLGHLPIPYLASVDMQPLLALKEKETFLEEALQNNYILFFEHDYYYECCNLKQTPKGIRANVVSTLNEMWQDEYISDINL